MSNYRLERVRMYFLKAMVRRVVYNLLNSRNRDFLSLVRIAERLDRKKAHRTAIGKVRELLENRSSVVLLLRNILDRNPRCVEKLAENFIAKIIYTPEWGDFLRKEGFNPPFTILISPTMRCNLRCVGCYAGEYSKNDDLELSIIKRVIEEGKSIGVCLFTILGGEPFVRDDMFEVYREHNDVYFQVFTNGTLITEEIAKRLSELGNVAPMMSLDGFRETNDAIRGPGCYKKVMRGMTALEREGVIFGFSVTVTKHNLDEVSSDEFIDMMIEKGALVGWYFLYMPVGRDPDVSLMPTPEQRLKLKERIEHVRASKPILTIDFWNDAPYVGGCIAGGKRYVHINSRGDIEPCIFFHFADRNIKEMSLREALRSSPLFKAIRDRQPYSENLYLPCAIIDHPDVLREIVAETHPYPTDGGADRLRNDESIRKHLDGYSRKLRDIYSPIWEKADKSLFQGCKGEG